MKISQITEGLTVPTNEAFDQPYKSKWGNSDYDEIDVLAKLPDGTLLRIMFDREGDDEWQVEFQRDHSTGVTGQGDAQRIFATVITAIQKFIKKRNPQVVRFSATKEVEPGQSSQSRAKLYDRLVQRYAHEWGYDAYREDHGDQVTYELTRLDTNTAESLEETYDGDEFYEAYGELWFNEDEILDEAEYHGRKVPLGKPMQGDVKKFKVYVKDPGTGNVKKVNFGDPNMRIKKSNPARRRSFRARHNCANPGPRTKARYWSCRKW